MSNASPLRVDIVSDVVCPWCAIGYYQLEKASRDSGIGIDVHWHPFELNPGMAPEGQDLREHIAEKYGTSAEDSRIARERMTDLGAALGFEFDYSDGMRMWNTFAAHQLIDWATEQGKGHRVKLALFAAHFTRHQNLSDPAVLADVAADVGLDRDAALAMLDSGDRADSLRRKEQFWTSRGITGVPAMIFGRQHLVVGAQGEETYANILEQLDREQVA